MYNKYWTLLLSVQETRMRNKILQNRINDLLINEDCGMYIVAKQMTCSTISSPAVFVRLLEKKYRHFNNNNNN